MGRSYKLQNGGRGNDRRTRKKVSMEIMLKKIEGYVFNIYLYHVSLKAFITNLEVVITISTDSLPTTYRQITNRRPTVGRQSADSRPTDRYHCGKTCRPTVGRLSADCQPTIGQLSANSWPTVGGGELFFTFTKSFVLCACLIRKLIFCIWNRRPQSTQPANSFLVRFF